MGGPTVPVQPPTSKAPVHFEATNGTTTDAPTAKSKDDGRIRLDAGCTGISEPSSASKPIVAEDYAFAFDIDGVLIRGGKPIPAAIEAMRVLNGENEYGVKMSASASMIPDSILGSS